MTKALLLAGRPGGSDLIVESWKATGEPCKVVRFEEGFHERDRRQHDDEILALAKDWQPDVAVYMSVNLRPEQIDGRQPHAGVPHDETFKALRDVCPVVHLCFDGVNPEWAPLLSRYLCGGRGECFDLHVNVD